MSFTEETQLTDEPELVDESLMIGIPDDRSEVEAHGIGETVTSGKDGTNAECGGKLQKKEIVKEKGGKCCIVFFQSARFFKF